MIKSNQYIGKNRHSSWAVSAAAALAISGLFGLPAMAQIRGANTVSGSATVQTSGNNTTIKASNKAIIEYSQFDLNKGESVRFIQPGASASVLNRIISAAPSRIDGQLTANGKVYFVNPAGVIFGKNSVVNVGELYAAAGGMSNEDFLAGTNRFTLGDGMVINQGSITASQAHLLGASVLNEGSIVTTGGVTTMTSAAGDVLISETGGRVFVKIENPAAKKQTAPTDLSGTAQTQNNGTIDAKGGTVKLIGAGDLYSLAVKNAGVVKAQNVEINAKNGTAVASGSIEAKNADGTKGGDVKVLGDRVAVYDAMIDASGTAGGGSILIGGDAHGAGETPTARQTAMGATATLKADATENGDGGKVIVWSDEMTKVFGMISAKGGAAGGNGGFIETSSRGILTVVGASVDAGAANGVSGVWLLDPSNIDITNADLNMTAASPFSPTADSATLDVATLVGALTGGSTVIVTTTNPAGSEAGNITVSSAINATNVTTATLNLIADGSITISNAITATAGPLNLSLQAAGDVSIGAAAITTLGGSFTSSGVNFTLNALGSIDTTGAVGNVAINNTGTITVNGSIHSGGAISSLSGTSFTSGAGGLLTADSGNVGVTSSGGISIGAAVLASGSITTSGTSFANAVGATLTATTGNISLTHTDAVTISDDLTASAGSITIQSGSDGTGDLTFAAASDLTAPTISLRAGDGSGAAAKVVMTSATFLGTGPGTSPTSFTHRQDATIADANIATLAQFGVAIPGTYSLRSDGGSVTISTAANVAGDLTVYGKTGVSIDDVLSLNSISVTTISGAIAETGLGGLTLAGAGEFVTGPNPITLDQTNSFGGNVTLNNTGANDATIVASGAFQLGGASSIGRNLSVTVGGDITEAAGASLTTGGTATFNAGAHAITLNRTNSFGGAVTMTNSGANNVQLISTGAVSLAASSVGSGTLSITAEGISQTGALTQEAAAGAVTINGGAEAIDLTNPGNSLTGAVTLTTTGADKAVGIFNNANLEIAAMTTGAGTHTVSVESSGALTVSGALSTSGTANNLSLTGVGVSITGAVDAGSGTIAIDAGGSTFSSGAGGTLTTTNATAGALSITNATTVAVGGVVSVVNGGISITATDSISLNENVTAGLTVTLNADSNDAGAGTVLVALNKTLNTSGHALNMNLKTLTLNGAIDCGTGTLTMTDSQSAGIGLGATAVAGGLNVTSADLTKITAGGLTLITAGNATVDGISQGGITGTLTIATAGGIAFTTTASNFGALDAQANNGITVSVPLTTNTGSLSLNGDENNAANGTDSIVISVASPLVALTSATSITLSAQTGGISNSASALIQAATSITVNDALTLGADAKFTGTAISFNGAISGAHGLTANGSATTTFGGTVNIASLTTDAGGTTAANANITTSGNQTYNDAVTINADRTFNAADLSFNGGLSGAHTVNATATGVTTLAGTTNVTTVVFDVAGTTTISGSITTSAALTFNEAVTLANDTTINSPTLSFTSTLGGIHDLTANVSGTTTFGNTVNIGSLTTDSKGDVTISAGITTSGDQTYNDPITLGADVTLAGVALNFNNTISGAHALIANASGTTTFGGTVNIGSLTTDNKGDTAANANITTSGNQTYNDAVTINADRTFNAVDLSFNAGLSGAHTVNATATGVTTLAGTTNVTTVVFDVAGTTTISGTITTSAALTFNEAVTLANDTTINSPTLSFTSTIGGIHALTANVSGTTAFGNTVNIGSLTTDSKGDTAVSANITTTGDQTYGDAVTIDADRTFTAANLSFNGGLSGPFTAIALVPGVTTLAGTTNVNTVSFDATGTTTISGSITTAVGLTFNEATTLAADTTINAPTLSFIETLGGDHKLTANVSGSTSFGDTVNIGSLITDAPGVTTISQNITTSGNQTYGDAVDLDADVLLTGVSISFNDTLGGAHALSVVSNGTTTFGGAVNLLSLATDAKGSTVISADITTTTGNQVYNDAVTMGADRTLTSAGTLTFNGTLDGAHGLTEAAAGVFALNGDVGSTTPLKYIMTDATGTISIAGVEVNTAGAQTYNAPVTLLGNATLGSTDGGVGNRNVTFNSTVNGAHALTINCANDTIFNEKIGGTTVLTALTTDNAGAPANRRGGRTLFKFAGTIANPSVLTTGNQTYNDAVVLNVDLGLVSNASGDIGFGSTVNGAQLLAINTRGDVTFGGRVGNTQALTKLVIGESSTPLAQRGNVIFNAASGPTPTITTVGSQEYWGHVQIQADAYLKTTSGDADTMVIFAKGVGKAGANPAADLRIDTVKGDGTTDSLIYFLATTDSKLAATANKVEVANLFINQANAADGGLRTAASKTASIRVIGGTIGSPEAIGTLPADGYTFSATNNIGLSRNERMTVLGSLFMDAATAQLSDITTLRDMNLAIQTLQLKTHASQTFQTPVGDRLDNGAFYTAGGKFVIAPGSNVTQDHFVPGQVIRIGASDQPSLQTSLLGRGFTARLITAPVLSDLVDTTLPLPPIVKIFVLEPVGNDVPIQPVTVINQVTIITPPAPIGESLVGQLEELGIIRFKTENDLSNRQFLSDLIGSAIYDDIPDKYATGALVLHTDFRLSRQRIDADDAQWLIDEFFRLYGDETKDPAVIRRKFTAMRDAIDLAATNYKKSKNINAIDSVDEFCKYLNNTPEESAAKDAMIRTHSFFLSIYPFNNPNSTGGIGLSAKEAEASRRLILSKFGSFRQIRPEQVLEAIMNPSFETKVAYDPKP